MHHLIKQDFLVIVIVSAQAKKQIMRECGIHVVESPAEIGKKVAEVLA